MGVVVEGLVGGRAAASPCLADAIKPEVIFEIISQLSQENPACHLADAMQELAAQGRLGCEA